MLVDLTPERSEKGGRNYRIVVIKKYEDAEFLARGCIGKKHLCLIPAVGSQHRDMTEAAELVIAQKTSQCKLQYLRRDAKIEKFDTKMKFV
jgi:hypothetical protein